MTSYSSIQPTQNYILCRLCDQHKTSLVLPTGASKMLPYLEVLAHGPDCKTTSIGDRLLVLPSVPICLEKQGADGENVYIVSEGSVMAKIVGEGNILQEPILSVN